MRFLSTDYSQNLQRKVIFFPDIFVFDCFESARVALWHLTYFPSNTVNASLLLVLGKEIVPQITFKTLQEFPTVFLDFTRQSI